MVLDDVSFVSYTARHSSLFPISGSNNQQSDDWSFSAIEDDDENNGVDNDEAGNYSKHHFLQQFGPKHEPFDVENCWNQLEDRARKYSRESICSALDAILNRGMTVTQASYETGIKRTSLQHYLKKLHIKIINKS